MIKRSLLVVGLLAVFFSAQADPMYYTFEGTQIFQTDIPGELNNPIIYQILIDFEASAINNGDVLTDYTDNINTISYNYGSAVFATTSGSVFIPVEDFVPLTLQALIVFKEFPDDYKYHSSVTINDLSNSVDTEDHYNFNLYGLSNVSPFNIGDVFNFTETKRNGFDFNDAAGSVILKSIGSNIPPVSSVPEPSGMVMLAGSIVALSGFGLRRKK
jgi:hypothetical protein